MPLDIVHRAAPCRTVPVTFTLAFFMNALRRFTKFPWQLGLSAFVVALLGVCLWKANIFGVDISTLDRSTYTTVLAGIASILALFCSISFAFVLFISQSNRTERVTAFDQFKARLLAAQQWLLSQPESEHRELCLSLVFELDKLALSDLPQTDYGPEYQKYASALEQALDGQDAGRREFYLTSVLYVGYIEQLLSRIGLISIRQIITKCFIDTLAKGVGIICLSIATLIASSIWYAEGTRPAFVLVGAFCGAFSILLFYEFCYDIYREYDEELDFVGERDDEKEG